MATKRRTDHESTREPDAPAVKAASADQPVSGGRRDEPEKKEPAARAGAAEEQAKPEAKQPEAEQAEAKPPEAQQAEAKPPEAQQAEAKPPEAQQAEAKPHEAAAQQARAPAPDRKADELASQLEEANGRHLRLAADFENYKKRVRQEQLDTMKYAAATVAERLLPVLDDADRALSHAPEGVDENWLKGVRLTFQKLEEVLGSVGVERIEALGAPFDPKQHEAVASEETAKHPEDTVVAELRAGYRMHDRVLRPALVKVARPPA
jgi:molecular chaperone GrpE